MTRPGFHTITLGCKLNQFDGAVIEGELSLRGYVPEPDPRRASVVIINTCTVTGKADAEARKLIRHVRRTNDRCRLLVTGCYAELDADTIRAIPGVDRVFGNREKPRLPAILDDLGLETLPVVPDRAGPRVELGVDGDRGCDSDSVPVAVHFGERSRAFLKVQEGCDLACSYCVIPQVRGASRSVPVERIEQAMGSLLESGYREIVLTGVNTGDYGKDLDPRLDLAALLRHLLAGCGPTRIRLNSLEPRTVTDDIIEIMASEPRLASHLQVPLQSGSEPILRRMRRNYRAAYYAERLEHLRSWVPDVGLGADVIVGFPGESDEHFEDTYRFIERSALSYLHVFAWSPRPGTAAAEYDHRPHGVAVRERSRRLRELADRLGYRFRRGFEGRTLDAVVLGDSADGTRLRALTGNYIEVSMAKGSARKGDLIAVLIREARPDETIAEPDGRTVWAAASA